jgi:hypothetical protein
MVVKGIFLFWKKINWTHDIEISGYDGSAKIIKTNLRKYCLPILMLKNISLHISNSIAVLVKLLYFSLSELTFS